MMINHIKYYILIQNIKKNKVNEKLIFCRRFLQQDNSRPRDIGRAGLLS